MPDISSTRLGLGLFQLIYLTRKELNSSWFGRLYQHVYSHGEYCTISTKCSVTRDTQDFLMCAKLTLIQKKFFSAFSDEKLHNFDEHLVEIVQYRDVAK
jgi:hypothetical protein